MRDLAWAGVSVLNWAFIQTVINKEVKNQPISWSSFNWVFFSSPKSARLFFSHFYVPSEIKLAALSRGTKAVIENEFQRSVHFFHDGLVEETANKFKEKLKFKEKVLFPIGEQSRRRIQALLDFSQYEEWCFYHTIPNPKDLKNRRFNAGFISSPSQLQGIEESMNFQEIEMVFVFPKMGAINFSGWNCESKIVDSYKSDHILATYLSHICS